MVLSLWSIWTTIRTWFIIFLAFISSLFTPWLISPVVPSQMKMNSPVVSSHVMIIDLEFNVSYVSLFKFGESGTGITQNCVYYIVFFINSYCDETTISLIIDTFVGNQLKLLSASHKIYSHSIGDNTTNKVQRTDGVADLVTKLNGIVGSGERSQTKVLVWSPYIDVLYPILETEFRSNQYQFLADSQLLLAHSSVKPYQQYRYAWLAIVYLGLVENPQMVEQCRLYYMDFPNAGYIDSSNIRPKDPSKPFQLSVLESIEPPKPEDFTGRSRILFESSILSLTLDAQGRSPCVAPNDLFSMLLSNKSIITVIGTPGQPDKRRKEECYTYVQIFINNKLKIQRSPSKDILYFLADKVYMIDLLYKNDTDNPIQIKQLKEIVHKECTSPLAAGSYLKCFRLIIIMSTLVDGRKLIDTTVVHFLAMYKDNIELWTAGLAVTVSAQQPNN